MSGIYVGIDGSSHSQLALEWAMREAVIRREPLTVIAVHEVPTSGWGGMIVYPQDSELREAVPQGGPGGRGNKVAAQLGDAAPSSVTAQASIGLPAAELIELSKDADLLVIGSRGAGGFTRLIVGSTSAQVSQHAHCPVVIVR